MHFCCFWIFRVEWKLRMWLVISSGKWRWICDCNRIGVDGKLAENTVCNEACVDAMTDCVDTTAGWIDLVIDCTVPVSDYTVPMSDCIDTVTGWIDTSVEDTLEATIGNGTVVKDSSLIKCCSAIAGDVNCLASWVVTFVLHDFPVRILIHTRNIHFKTYLCNSGQFSTVAE